MKNKKKRLVKIVSVILTCFILMPYLYACRTEDNTIENDNNIGAVSTSENSETFNTDVSEAVYASQESKEIADAIMAVYSSEELPEAGMKYYFSGAGESSENYIDPEKFGTLMNGNPSVVEETKYLEDFALYTPSGKNIFEVDILRVKQGEEDKIEAVKGILKERLKRKDNGDVVLYVPEDAPILKNAKIMVVNNYVILLATTDNERAEAAINNMLSSGTSLSNTAVADGNTAEKEQPQATENKAASISISMDGVVDVEPEILVDFNELPTAPITDIEQSGQVEQVETEQSEPTELTEQIEQIEQAQDNVPMQEERTDTPSVAVKSYSHNTSFIIGGKCEIGAKIRVTGGTEEIFTGSDYGDYLVEVPFSETGTSVLKMTAIADGKLPSEEISFVVKPQQNISYYEDSGIYGVVVGYNYMSYFDDCMPDFLGSNLLDSSEIAALQARTEKRISDLRDKGCNAEIIYLIAPNTVRLWPEDVPERYTEYKDDTLKRQWKEAVTAGGATVLDLTDLMMAHKNDEFKIWHKTDSHWTEYGAMLAYYELMNYISQKFPDAAPRPRSDFEPYYAEVNFGDIYKTLGLKLTSLRETSTFVRFNFDPPHYNPSYDTGHVDLYDGKSVCLVHSRVQFEHTTKTNLSGNFPSVYVFRDSFEGPLHAFITDRFSTATFRGMWDYNFNMNTITGLNPDYILYVISERNIKNVLYN